MKNCEEPWICAREASNGKPQYAGKRARRSWEIGERASAVAMVGVVESFRLCVVYYS